jgi:folate-dependent phosphoribosylglycinamide formyltransferase PurN
MSDMRLCIVSSSAGGAFRAFFRLAGIPAANILILTDRPCGIEDVAREHSIPHVRLAWTGHEAFSQEAATQIAAFGGVDVVMLFYSRLVTPALFARHQVVNFHPALLPAFPGFHAIKRALQAGVKFFGTTMHVVDATLDGGQILAQGIHPLKGDEHEDDLGYIAFLQKVYLMLLVAEHHEIAGKGPLQFSDWPCGDRWNPSLRSEKYLELYASLVRSSRPPGSVRS